MNENLVERFKRGKGGNYAHQTRVELRVLPQKLNNKIRQYYEPSKKPIEAGPWLDRSEAPTSAEILDVDTDNSSNSDIVEIVPNRETGGWESTGELSHYTIPSCRTH